MSTSTPTTDMYGLLARLPNELYQDIQTRVTVPSPIWAQLDPSKDPSIAPQNGSSPFLALPCEMRRQILSYLLPSKDKIIEPSQSSTNLEADTLSFTAARQRIDFKPDLRVGDALVLNKKIASEILIMLYEERTFAINIHEGILDGGVEFLDSGLQQLQYREHFTQVRFKRFEGPEDPYGFSRIKRLLIRIYPAKEEATEKKTSRHDVMHTHFMLRALVQLLQRDPSFGLNYLQIRFIEPRRTPWRPHPWQNSSNSLPRSSSIHGVSNVEVIMRALLELRKIHTIACVLPIGLYKDSNLKEFVEHFKGVITGNIEPNTMDHYLALQIEGARDMLDGWIQSILFPATKVTPENH
ncbi:unnamed protein product [Aureobasidium pullulans]|nr:unnamed protein product [Aureobasidium pullulans]